MSYIQGRFMAQALLLTLPLLPLLHLASPGRADLAAVAQPYAAIHYEHETSVDPAQQMYIARIDLTNPNVDVRVAPGGADPDGAGEYQTTLQKPTTIAEREHFEVAINGDFFTARNTADAEGSKSGYVADKWAKVIGPAVTDGYLWAPAPEPRATLLIDAQTRPSIRVIKDVPIGVRQVIAGSNVLLRDGQIIAQDTSSFTRSRHPRTAVGIADDGKTLVLVVVDGRHAGVAVGMSLPELAELMHQIGCRDALNLDGGGSSEMVLRDPQDGMLQVLNHPSDGRERAVGNVLGISIRGSRRMPSLLPPTAQNGK